MADKNRFGFLGNFFGNKEVKVNTPRNEKTTLYTDVEKDGSFTQFEQDTGLPDVGRSNNIGTIANELSHNATRKQKLKVYRRMSKSNEISRAVEDIINECIVVEDGTDVVKLNLEETDIKDNLQNEVKEEFEKILRLLNFRKRGQDYFMDWYIDGEIYFEISIDKKRPKNGIINFNKIDPINMTKVKKVLQKMEPETQKVITTGYKKYFLYSPLETNIKHSNGTRNLSQRILFNEHNLLYSTSGLVDYDKNIVVGYLDKAVRPYNQLKLMEDALVVYRLARAPERRVFYIDTGNMPKSKAEGYLRRIMNTYKNKIVYDGESGTLKDTNNQMMMQDDFWLPRADGKGTEVSTLQGAQNLGEIEDVDFFRRNLNESLHVPLSRLEPDSGNVLGRATEITRDELNFKKFTDRLQSKFSEIFLQALRVQLILKGMTTAAEWETFKDDIRFDFNRDSFFTELKHLEIFRDRISILNEMIEYRDVYFSNTWIRKNILQQNEEEIKEIDAEIKQEKPVEQFDKPLGDEQPEGEDFGDEGDGGEPVVADNSNDNVEDEDEDPNPPKKVDGNKDVKKKQNEDKKKQNP